MKQKSTTSIKCKKDDYFLSRYFNSLFLKGSSCTIPHTHTHNQEETSI